MEIFNENNNIFLNLFVCLDMILPFQKLFLFVFHIILDVDFHPQNCLFLFNNMSLKIYLTSRRIENAWAVKNLKKIVFQKVLPSKISQNLHSKISNQGFKKFKKVF